MIKMSPRRIRNLNMSRSVGLSTVVLVESQRFPANINVLHWFSSPFPLAAPRLTIHGGHRTRRGMRGRRYERTDSNWNGNVSVREISLRGSEIGQKGAAHLSFARWMLWNLEKIEHVMWPSRVLDQPRPSSIPPYINLVDSTSMTVIHSSPTRLTCV